MKYQVVPFLKGTGRFLYPIIVLTWKGWHKTYLTGSLRRNTFRSWIPIH